MALLAVGLWLFGLPATTGPNAASRDELEGCPTSIEVHEKLAGRFPGWTEGRTAEPHRLASVTLFDGPPEQGASLVGDEQTPSETEMVVRWSFTEHQRPYWLSCSYANTGVTLSRSIPPRIRSCSVTYARRVLIAGMPQVLRIDCTGP